MAVSREPRETAILAGSELARKETSAVTRQPHRQLMVQLQEEPVSDQPIFEITHVQSNADVEYVAIEGKPEPVLRKYVDVTVRFWGGFDWQTDVKALIKRLQKAEELNDL